MKTNKINVITLLLVLVVALHSCKKYKVENDLHLPGVDYQLSGKLLCIDPSAELISTEAERQEGIYKFTYSGIDVPYIQVDKIIVGEQGNGFLRKVTELISRSDTEISLQTTAASMTDAFIAGGELLDLNFSTLSASFDKDTLLQAPGFKLIASAGSLDYTPDINLEYQIVDSALNQMVVSMNGNFNIDLQTKLVSGSLNEIDEQAFLVKEETVLQTIKVAVGEKQVPIVVATEVKIMGYLSSANGTSNDTTVINWDWSLQQDLSYTFSDKTWSASPTKSIDGTASVIQRSSFGNSHYQIKFIPTIAVQIYNEAAFDFQQEVNLDYDFTTDNADNWCNTLDANFALNYASNPQIFQSDLNNHEGVEMDDPITTWQAPAFMEVQGNNIVSGAPGDVINNLSVSVTDTEGLPVAGAKIYYEVTMGGGSINSSTAVSNTNGVATNAWTLGNNNQPQMLIAYWKKNGGIAQDTVGFVANPPPCDLTASLTQLNTIDCFGESTASLSAEPVGGFEPFQYQWSNGSTTDTISNLGAGTYVVTISDLLNCTAVDSFIINQPPDLNITLDSSNDPLCTNNGMINISIAGGTAAGDYTYSWSNGMTTQDLTQLMGGTYTVTVTDDNLCEATLPVILQDLSGLSVNLTETHVNCNGTNDGAASSMVNGGTAPYTYLWSNGATSDDATGLAPGQYSLTVTDSNGCEASAMTTINEPSQLTVTGTHSDLLCNGYDDGSIDLIIDGGVEPYSFSWSDNSPEINRTNLSAGNYSVVVTDNNACTAMYSVDLNEPNLIEVTNNKTEPTCNGEDNGSITVSVSGGTGSYSYEWNNGNTTTELTYIVAGSYELTVTDDNNCSAIESFTLDEPDVLLANGSGDVMIDSMEMTTIMVSPSGGTGDYDFEWSNGFSNSPSQDVSPMETTTYSVTVTDENDCVRVASMTVTLNP